MSQMLRKTDPKSIKPAECHNCGGTDFWLRTAWGPPGWLCNKCHPDPNTPDMITPNEAENDGFRGMHGGGDVEKMRKFFIDTYGYRKCEAPINKLTLYWLEVKP